jgi:RecB family endonuclease NucS
LERPAANFKGSYFVFDADVWEGVIELAADNGSPDLPGIVAKYSAPGPSQDIVSEHQLRDALAQNPEALGLGDLALYTVLAQPGVAGKEFRCPDVGFIDLLLTDDQGIPIVVEHKTKRAGEAVIGQIGKYMGWVKKNLPGGENVRGVVVSDGYDARYEAASSLIQGLSHIEVSEVRNRLGS